MARSLQSQILVRLLLVLAGTLLVVTLANLWAIDRIHRQLFAQRIERIRSIVTQSSFPLTSNVLDQMASLADAEFLVVDSQNRIQAHSRRFPRSILDRFGETAEALSQGDSTELLVAGTPYHHTVARVPDWTSRGNSSPPLTVHILIDASVRRSAWRQSIWLPIAIGLALLPPVGWVGWKLASRVARPLTDIDRQLQQVASGDRDLSPLPFDGATEIARVQQSLRELADRLRDHEHQLRKNEQLRTLVQISRGVAHKLKNSVTGCRMAIDLAASSDPTLAERQEWQVARRQLTLMTDYIERFVAVERSESTAERSLPTPIDLRTVLDHTLFLLQPTVRHLNVQLSVARPEHPVVVQIGEDDARQMMLNLIQNALEAASSQASQSGTIAQVDIQILNDGNRVQFTVRDNGPGPPEDIAARIVEPFVTGKPEGIGLGLALVDDLARSRGGQLSWNHAENWTRFTITLPLTTNH